MYELHVSAAPWLGPTDMNVLGVDEPSVLRPHIITSRFSLRNLVPSDTSSLFSSSSSSSLSPPPSLPSLYLSVSLSLSLVSDVLAVFLYRRALAGWFARSCMHRSQIPSYPVRLV